MEIPYVFVQTLLFGVITYFMVNFERTMSKIPSSTLMYRIQMVFFAIGFLS